MLPFEQLRKDLVQDVSYRDKAIYSPKIDLADDFDEDHPVTEFSALKKPNQVGNFTWLLPDEDILINDY